MSLLRAASSQSAYRGYRYFEEKRVTQLENVGDGLWHAVVLGSQDRQYSVTVDLAHPRKSQCNCPHADGRSIVCKHMAAVYFTLFPEEARQYMADLEAAWKEEEEADREAEEQLRRYVLHMKKAELQAALLELLFDGPEWQYERFLRDRLGR